MNTDVLRKIRMSEHLTLINFETRKHNMNDLFQMYTMIS
jgi:hypothetical protein